VFDADSAVLVASDALTSTIHGLADPNLEIMVDPAKAADSVRKLPDFEPRVIFVGHGAPLERDAATQLQRLADSLS